MNKFKTFAITALLLTVAACDNSPAAKAHKSFVQMCQEDPRSKKGFSCECQADILQSVLLENEMTQLVEFLNAEKVSREKAMELGRDPKYIPMFKKIGGIGLAIHDKCGGREAQQAELEQQQQSAPAPAAEAPAVTAPAKEAAKPAAKPAPAAKEAPVKEESPAETEEESEE